MIRFILESSIKLYINIMKRVYTCPKVCRTCVPSKIIYFNYGHVKRGVEYIPDEYS